MNAPQVQLIGNDKVLEISAKEVVLSTNSELIYHLRDKSLKENEFIRYGKYVDALDNPSPYRPKINNISL